MNQSKNLKCSLAMNLALGRVSGHGSPPVTENRVMKALSKTSKCSGSTWGVDPNVGYRLGRKRLEKDSRTHTWCMPSLWEPYSWHEGSYDSHVQNDINNWRTLPSLNLWEKAYCNNGSCGAHPRPIRHFININNKLIISYKTIEWTLDQRNQKSNYCRRDKLKLQR